MNNKTFNIVITGVGGQGIITLLSIINEAAFVESLNVRSSELHGLSQRGGSVEAHIRLGKKAFSPLVCLGRADLIISLELFEALGGISKANSKTKFLANDYLLPFEGSLKREDILAKLKSSNLFLIPASDICKEKLQKEVVSSIYLLGCGVFKNIIPLKPESVLKAIKNIIPEKYQELNIKAFQLAKT